MRGTTVQKATPLLILANLLSACDIYIVDSGGGLTPVPLISAATIAPTVTPIPGTATPTEFPATQAAEAPPEAPAPTEVLAPPPTAAAAPYEVEILGCDTGFDLVHGMYEVTNAYVTVRNTSGTDVANACTLLRALDEEREHPDKERCVDLLPSGYQVTQKLTVDSTFQAETAVQVDLHSHGTVLLRVSREACPDVNVLGGAPAGLGLILPIAP